MQANLKLIKKRRKYSEEFKRNIVTEFESGSLSVSQISRLYTIAEKSIYRWIYKFSIFNEKESRIIEMKESSTKKVKDLEKKLKDLERIVGQKQIMIDYLEKMIEIAKDELDIDIKKNYSTQRSSGSSKTKKK